MNILISLPVFFPIIFSLGCLFIRRESFQRSYAAVISAVELILCIYVGLYCKNDVYIFTGVLAGSFSLKVNALSGIYIIIISSAWVASAIVSIEYMHHYHNTKLYYFCYLITLAMTVGVFLSADFMSAFVCFEVMSFSSFVWVIFEENNDSVFAAKTYLGVAILGSMFMFLGMGIISSAFDTLNFDELRNVIINKDDYPMIFAAGIMITAGFGAKAAVFPLHIWLPKAHPVAPAPASALLSGLLTKVGIFGIIAVSAALFYSDMLFGSVLWILSLLTMFIGAFLAVMSDNFKRTLACSSMSQIGFIMMGIASFVILGEEASVATTGTVGYMMNHSLFKCLLFSVAAVIYMNTHKLNLNDIRGFGRKKILLKAIFLIGCLGIGAIPCFSGYISKTLIHEALLECAHHFPGWVITSSEVIFMISGGCTIAYMSKLFVCVFVEKNKDNAVQEKYDNMKNYMSPLTSAVLIVLAMIIVFFGNGETLIHTLNGANEFFNVSELHHIPHFFSLHELSGAFKSISIALCVYFIVIRRFTVRNAKYVNPVRIDLQNHVYMPLIEFTANALHFILSFFGENKLSRPVAKAGMEISYNTLKLFGENKLIRPVAKTGMEASYNTLKLFGENKVLQPVSKMVMKIYGMVSAVFSESIDAVMFMISCLPFVKAHKEGSVHIGNAFSDAVGIMLDRFTHQDKFQIYFADLERNISRIWNNITNSFSFALLMTVIGLCAVLVRIILF